MLSITTSLLEFDENKVFKNTIDKLDIPYLIVEKYSNTYSFTEYELSDIKKLYNDCDFYTGYDRSKAFVDVNFGSSGKGFYPELVMEYDKKMFNDYNIKLAWGRVPVNENEILISEMTYFLYRICGYGYYREKIVINSYSDIIDKNITIFGNECKIVGITKSEYTYDEVFEKYKSDAEPHKNKIYSDFDYVLFVNKGFFEKNDIFYLHALSDINILYGDISIYGGAYFTNRTYNSKIYYKDNKEVKKLKGNQVILNYNQVINQYSINFGKMLSEKIQQLVDEYALANYEKVTNFNTYEEYSKYILESYNNKYDRLYNKTYFENLAKEVVLNEIMNYDNLSISYSVPNKEKVKIPVEVVGIADFSESGGRISLCNYVSDELYEKIVKESLKVGYKTLYITYKENLDEMFQMIDEKYNINNKHMVLIKKATAVVSLLSDAFRIIGGVLLIFSLLLLLSFFVYIICDNKKKTGIYMLLGMKKSDLGKMYFFESGLLMLSILVLSIIGGFVFVNVINKILIENYNLEMVVLRYSYKSILYVIGLAVINLIISMSYPTIKFKKMLPFEALRG